LSGTTLIRPILAKSPLDWMTSTVPSQLLPTNITFLQRLGADRAAQGVPSAGCSAGVQAGRSRALEIAINRGRAAGIPDDVLLEVLLELDRYGAMERHVIAATAPPSGS
jgi:hypothetical protein